LPTAEGYVKYICPLRGRPEQFNYVFNHKDHLGNIRMSYAMDKEKGKIYIMEENHYYPFGMKHEKYNSDKYEYVEISKEDGGYLIGIEPLGPQQRRSYQYKYNGKEYQDELGLNFYDYVARNYDPAIGRWMNIDPKADERQMFTPYNYVQNNPIKRIDPTGMLDEWVKDGDNYIWDDRVTDQATAEQYRGSGASYIGKAATVTSKQGGRILDSVKLNSDGSVTKNNVTLEAGSDGAFVNAAGSSFQPRQTQGSFISFGFDGAFVGGFGVQLGLVNDAVGSTDFFINFNGNIGFGLFTGLSTGTVSPTGGNQFVTSDFAGNSSSYSAGANSPIYDASWTSGGTIDSNMHAVDKMNPSNFGRNKGEIQRGYTIEQSGMAPGTGWGGGLIYSYGTTKTF
jgi:RHS repeat-associated protein